LSLRKELAYVRAGMTHDFGSGSSAILHILSTFYLKNKKRLTTKENLLLVIKIWELLINYRS
jgi:hypothetical protein